MVECRSLLRVVRHPANMSGDAGAPLTASGFKFSENNFDLIRLVAASEVAIRHTVHHIAPEREAGPLCFGCSIWCQAFRSFSF